MEKLLNNVSEDDIIREGMTMSNIVCDTPGCGYETGVMDLKSAVFKITMQGGYVMFDGHGGLESKCPACGIDNLYVD